MNLFLKKYLPFFVLFALFSIIIFMCSVPPISRDALTHHLAVPKLYVHEGFIHELPHIIPSYYPQLLDLIYCIPLIFDDDIIPKYIHFSFGLLTAALIFFYLQQRLNYFFGLMSVLFFLSLPVIVKLSVTVYVDLGLIFFSTASLLCLLKWHEKEFRFRWLFLSALWCGLCLSTKYNGLITCFLLTAFTPILYLKTTDGSSRQMSGDTVGLPFQKRKFTQIKAAGYGISFLLISTAFFSPWMIKNYVWTQNPVYPLYNNYFNPVSGDVSLGQNTKTTMNHFLIRKYIYDESWFETASIPLRIFFQGEDDNPKFFDGKLNPLLFILPFFAFVFPKKPIQDFFHRKIMLSFALLYILIVFFQQDMRIRWIGPAIPPLVILSAYGLKNIFQLIKPDKILKPKNIFNSFQIKISVIFMIIFSLASLNAMYIYQLFQKIAPHTYITHQVTRAEYIEKFRPEYASLQFANQHLKGNVKLLAFFLGGRRYYSDHDIRFDDALFKKMVQDSETVENIFQCLKIQNFTNLIINYPKFNSWIERSFDTEGKKRVQLFFNQYTERLFSGNGHGVYQLKNIK